MAITNLADLRKLIGSMGTKGSRIGQFNTLRLDQKKAQNFYDMNFDFKIYTTFEKIKLPTARQMQDTFVSHLPLSNPVVEVIPFKDKAPYVDRAVKLQEFSHSLLRQNMRQTDNFILNGAKDLGIRGEAFLKTLWDVNVIEGMEGKRKGESEESYRDRVGAFYLEKMPIKMTCPDPMSCYPSRDHIDCTPADMLEVYTVLVSQVKRVFPDWKTALSNHQPVKIYEWWTDKSRCFLAGETKVALTDGIEENPYGFMPYVHVYSGWGVRDEDNSPESKAVSILRGAYDLLIQQCRWFGYLDKAVAWTSMPQISAKGVKADYEEGRGLTPKPGDVNYDEERTGVKLTWAAPNLPAGILEALGLSDALLGRAQPAVLRGEAPRGVEAGYPMALMIGEARLQFGIPLMNLETLVARGLEKVRFLIRDVAKDEVPVWGDSKVITVGKEDCDGHYRVNLTFDATTPEMRADRAFAGQRLRQGGSISHYTELKDYHNIKNPDEELDRIAAESILEHPAIQREIAVEAVREKKGDEVALAVKQAMEEGEAGAARKEVSRGGGVGERPVPEDVLSQVISRQQRGAKPKI